MPGPISVHVFNVYRFVWVYFYIVNNVLFKFRILIASKFSGLIQMYFLASSWINRPHLNAETCFSSCHLLCNLYLPSTVLFCYLHHHLQLLRYALNNCWCPKSFLTNKSSIAGYRAAILSMLFMEGLDSLHGHKYAHRPKNA